MITCSAEFNNNFSSDNIKLVHPFKMEMKKLNAEEIAYLHFKKKVENMDSQLNEHKKLKYEVGVGVAMTGAEHNLVLIFFLAGDCLPEEWKAWMRKRPPRRCSLRRRRSLTRRWK